MNHYWFWCCGEIREIILQVLGNISIKDIEKPVGRSWTIYQSLKRIIYKPPLASLESLEEEHETEQYQHYC